MKRTCRIPLHVLLVAAIILLFNVYTLDGKSPVPPIDIDMDTVPDEVDPYPYDFNNDATCDIEYNGNIDGDGLEDYPFGSDHWLNTTIPNAAVFPAAYRGKDISLYIGPNSLQPPSNLSLEVALNGSKIELSWDIAFGPDVHGYNIYRFEGSECIYDKINDDVIINPLFIDYNVTAGTGYSYFLRTVNQTGIESHSSRYSGAVVPAQPDGPEYEQFDWFLLFFIILLIIIGIVIILIMVLRKREYPPPPKI
jgi:hypothetical protein